MLSKHRVSKAETELKLKLKHSIAQDLGIEGYEMLVNNDHHLASGSYGIVYKCTKNRKEYAVKIVTNAMDLLVEKLDFPDWKLSKTSAKREQKYFEKIGTHENVIQLETMFYRKHELSLLDGETLVKIKTFYTVMEFADSKSLEQLVIDRGALDENMAKFLVRDLRNALEYLHSKGIAHLDVKPSNCLLCRNYNNKKCEFVLKLADFNLATSDKYLNGDVGTVQTMCPEFLRFAFLREKKINPDKPASTFKADYWSMGATVYYMFHSQFPLVNSSSRVYLKQLSKEMFLDRFGQVENNSNVYYGSVAAKILPPYNPLISMFCWKMLNNLLQVNPAKRALPPSEKVEIWIQHEGVKKPILQVKIPVQKVKSENNGKLEVKKVSESLPYTPNNSEITPIPSVSIKCELEDCFCKWKNDIDDKPKQSERNLVENLKEMIEIANDSIVVGRNSIESWNKFSLGIETQINVTEENPLLGFPPQQTSSVRNKCPNCCVIL